MKRPQSELVGFEALSEAEHGRKAQLEDIIERGRATFIAVGNALAEIRDAGLYRATHSAFADYLRDRWDMSASQAYRLIDAADIVDAMVEVDEREVADESVPNRGHSPAPVPRGNGGRRLPLPKNESVVRRLAATADKDPQRALDIWKDAVTEYGPGATAEQVASVAAAHAPAQEEEPVDVAEERKRYSSAASAAFRKDDARSARKALAIWRQKIGPALERISKHGHEREPGEWIR